MHKIQQIRYAFLLFRLFYNDKLFSQALTPFIMLFMCAIPLFFPIVLVISSIIMGILLGGTGMILNIIGVILLYGGAYLFSLALAGAASAHQFHLSKSLQEKNSVRKFQVTRSGTFLHHSALSFFSAILVPVTAGLIIPLRSVLLQRNLVEKTNIEGRRFIYSGSAISLYPLFLIVWAGIAYLVVTFAYTIQTIVLVIISHNLFQDFEANNKEELEFVAQSIVWLLKLSPYVFAITIAAVFLYIRLSINLFISSISYKNMSFRLSLPFWKTVGYTLQYVIYFTSFGFIFRKLPLHAARFFVRNLEMVER